MVDLHIKLHHLIEIEGRDTPADSHSHCVAEEVKRMVIFQELPDFLELLGVALILLSCFVSVIRKPAAAGTRRPAFGLKIRYRWAQLNRGVWLRKPWREA